MKLKTRKATNSYETDEELAAAVMSKMGKQVRETLNANAKMGEDYGMADTKERLADLISTRRDLLRKRGYEATNREVLDSLGNSETFRSKTERSEENAFKGFMRSILPETIMPVIDNDGNVKYNGYEVLPNGRYRDLSTGKLVSGEYLYEHNAAGFKTALHFNPGETKLIYDPINKSYTYHGTDGKDYEIIFGKEYTKTGGVIVKLI